MLPTQISTRPRGLPAYVGATFCLMEFPHVPTHKSLHPPSQHSVCVGQCQCSQMVKHYRCRADFQVGGLMFQYVTSLVQPTDPTKSCGPTWLPPGCFVDQHGYRSLRIPGPGNTQRDHLPWNNSQLLPGELQRPRVAQIERVTQLVPC